MHRTLTSVTYLPFWWDFCIFSHLLPTYNCTVVRQRQDNRQLNTRLQFCPAAEPAFPKQKPPGSEFVMRTQSLAAYEDRWGQETREKGASSAFLNSCTNRDAITP